MYRNQSSTAFLFQRWSTWFQNFSFSYQSIFAARFLGIMARVVSPPVRTVNQHGNIISCCCLSFWIHPAVHHSLFFDLLEIGHEWYLEFLRTFVHFFPVKAAKIWKASRMHVSVKCIHIHISTQGHTCLRYWIHGDSLIKIRHTRGKSSGIRFWDISKNIETASGKLLKNYDGIRKNLSPFICQSVNGFCGQDKFS